MPVDLSLIDPALLAKIGRVLETMHASGHQMRITDGRRTDAQQALKFAQGRTLKGAIVTYIDGLHIKSKHQLGQAVDCCFLGPDPYADDHPWDAFGQAVRAEGLFWGGDFRPHVDRPHVELRTPLIRTEVA